jgi:hypothetical protein
VDIETISDVKLAGRALKDWLKHDDPKRQQAVEAIYDVVINNADPKMKTAAFTALLQADAVDLKRQEVEIKKQAADDHKRLRLLEILRHLPPGELGKLTSGDSRFTVVGREDQGPGAEGEAPGV